jgi:transposase
VARLRVVQTAEGLPLYHEVFDGNTAEVQTLKPTLQKIVARYPVKRVIAVADRGLLSVDNLEELKTITLPGGGRLEFILAVPRPALWRIRRTARATAQQRLRTGRA